MEQRFEALEEKVIWLEEQLVVMGRLVEQDVDRRIQQATEQKDTELPQYNESSRLWTQFSALFRA
jgi:hypothetical protein